MAQLSLYMDDAAMEELRADAAEAGVSISSYARDVLEKRRESGRGWVNGWPPGYFDSLEPLNIELSEDLPPEPVEVLNTL